MNMKNFFKLMPFLLMVIFAGTIVSCSDDDDNNDESCDQFDDNVGTCSAADITACCDDEGACYYLYKGDRYNDVNALAAQCASGSAMQIQDLELQLDNFTVQLINEARTAALCD
jgi:hypothetical protein